MLETIYRNVVVGFLVRWAQEVGGIATILIGLYMAASPADQDAIQAIVMGQGGGLSLNTYIGLAIYAFGRWQAYWATVKPQVVTTDGQKITPKPDGGAMRQIEAVAEQAPRQKTLAERILETFGRR